MACIGQRNQLLENGYLPLPLDGKRPTYKGWTRQEISADWLDSFRRKTKYANTGLRCDNLIAFDIDVLDFDMACDIEELIEKHAGQTELCRYGKMPKRLLVYRLDGAALKSARSGRYGGHMVELLATRGRQFVACGIHPETQKPYTWASEELTPLTIPYNDLPALDAGKALEILDLIDDYLADTGLPQETNARRLGVTHPDIYDMRDDTDCQLADGSEWKWSELRSTLDQDGVMGNLRREDGEYGDSNGVHFYLSDIDAAPVAYDFARDTFHREAPATQKLAAALPPAAPQQQIAPNYLQDFIDHWVILGDATARRIDHPFREYRLAALRDSIYAHQTIIQPTKRGTGKPVPVVAIWTRHPQAKRADYAAMRPDHPDEILIAEGRETIFNTYRRRALPVEGGEVETFLAFMRHLFPEAADYSLALDWIAHKYTHPGERMHGLLMVTSAFGTGRNTLAKILKCLLGENYVKDNELHNLVGSSGQAAYNEYLSDSLIVYIAEAQEYDEKATRYASRRGAYERLKILIDPMASMIYVKRKYGRNTTERTFASILIASNHIDALAIDKEDRRLIVLDCTRKPLSTAPKRLRERIHAWYQDGRNIGALARFLIRHDQISKYSPYDEAPMTRAKKRMLEASQNDLDMLYEQYVNEAPGDVCTIAQLTRYVIREANANDYDIPDPGGVYLDRALKAILGKRAERFNHLVGNKQIRCDKKQVRPWIIRNVDSWVNVTVNREICIELQKNGISEKSNIADINDYRRDK